MMAELPCVPPVRATAGDSWSWRFRDDRYPSSAWTLAYTVIGIGKLTWDPSFAVADSDRVGFTVTVTPGASAELPCGPYRVFQILTAGTERDSVERERLTVAPDPAQLEIGDTLTWAERELADLEAAIAAFTKNGAIVYYQVGRRIFQRSALDMMFDQRARLKSEIAMKRQTRGGIGRRYQVRLRGAGR